jgi:hypothetical protein
MMRPKLGFFFLSTNKEIKDLAELLLLYRSIRRESNARRLHV